MGVGFFCATYLTMLRKITMSMRTLAWRNLVHDKVRLTVTVTGIVFAVVLIVVELGLFLGFTTTTSSLIDRSNADLWITAPRVPYIEQGVPFSERKLATVLATPGVRTASKYIAQFTQWKRPDGRQESVQVVGIDVASGLGLPWSIVAGTLDDLRKPDAVFVDEIYREKLGVERIGQIVEIRGRRARIAGFTRGIRAFTTSPYVFTTFKNALDFTSLREDQTLYILVKAASGTDVEALRQTLASRLSDVDVADQQRLQPHDARLLDVHHRRGHRGSPRGGAGAGRWRGGRRADDLRDDGRSHPRVRDAQGDGGHESISLWRHCLHRR